MAHPRVTDDLKTTARKLIFHLSYKGHIYICEDLGLIRWVGVELFCLSIFILKNQFTRKSWAEKEFCPDNDCTTRGLDRQIKKNFVILSWAEFLR